LNSLPDRCRQWLRARLTGSIVVRTTLFILALSLVLGFTFAAIVSRGVERHERQRAALHLRELLATVARPAQIACFLSDGTLAAEIAHGLLSNQTVAGVRIQAGGVTLFEEGRVAQPAGRDVAERVVSQLVYSPFSPETPVGSISLYVADELVREQARRDSLDAALLLAGQAVLVAAGVALAVFLFVTKPIRSVSNELHKARLRSGDRLRVPPRNEFNEIGQLVGDVNVLIADLNALLDSERDLRVRHEVSERKLRLIFDKAETGLFVVAVDGTIQSSNPAFARLLGRPLATWSPSGILLPDLLEGHRDTVMAMIRDSLASGRGTDVDLELVLRESQPPIWVEMSLNPISDRLLQGVIDDISERKRGEINALQLATHDSLTGLLNRHGFQSSLKAAFSRATPDSSPPVALLQIDLDHFKQVNDTYGHEAGDRVLRHVARVLERALRQGDLIGRLGGDEFTAALVGISSSAKAEELARRIVAEIRRPIDVGDGRTARIGASIGVALATPHDPDAESVLRRADEAMYAAKRAGRNRVCVVALGSGGPLEQRG
jgi:diguanylate cyclase (GGDEF)-like protein/PAS domain S-box-containing protein